ncbi:TonB-dependent receptor [Methylosinus sp. Sm6]|uniref:TonB-dependent receptor n=1 Tax=Methylosinus sp. Sm6 TaxID=2866948 RepID=UPI001C994F82|nr:TonB-dependent receptor [Methylosinus sp. Sm6]MBY6241146.1 TonB-dependent receptor [Methylosinus sp. Sm6]
MPWRRSRLSLVALLAAATSSLAARAQEALPDIDIATAPEAGAKIERSKISTNPISLTRGDLDRDHAVIVTDTLLRRNASVSSSEVAGNPFQPDISYRGFAASPVPGTPQGLAVYQDGVRINEAFGDSVNFDLIPSVAIAKGDIVSGNPLFGLNALGGALTLEMKNGFTWQGFEADGRGGSFGRRFGSLQYGRKIDDFAVYFAFEGLGEDGWRKRSGSSILRGYADLGYKGDKTEFHLNFTGAGTRLGNAAATPIEMLQRDYGSVFTTPQSSYNDLLFVNLKGAYEASSHLKFNGNAYFRQFRQQHIDGNLADVETCGANDKWLCQETDGFTSEPSIRQVVLRDSSGRRIPASLLNDGGVGSLDYTRVNSRAFGFALQGTYDEAILGFANKLVIGAAHDRQHSDFRGYSELGVLQNDLSVAGTGVLYSNLVPEGGFQPVHVGGRNLYWGVYAHDTLEVTDKLTATAGLRFNSAEVALFDHVGAALNSNALYQRVNPVAGLTYSFFPELTVYGNYSEANRAPTALENGCSDRLHPCMIDNFLVSDPPLKQVVARTWETGLRGRRDFGGDYGRLDWRAGLFRTDSVDDILSLPSDVIQGRGYFANVGQTRRQGVEAGVTWQNDLVQVYADYALIDATFRNHLTLNSGDNPYADENGQIHVQPGNVLPGIPRHRVKVGFDFKVTPQWTFGLDYIFRTGVHLAGDEANLDKPLPSFGVVNLKTSYKITDNIEVYGLVNNLFDRRAYSFGTYFETGSEAIGFLGLSNPRTLGPISPLAAYGGVKVRF